MKENPKPEIPAFFMSKAQKEANMSHIIFIYCHYDALYLLNI